MKEYSTYRTFDTEQWLDDPDFLQWVKRPEPESDAVFFPLLNENSEASLHMKMAMDILQNMDRTDHALTDEEMVRMWDNVAERTLRRKKTLLRHPVWNKIFLSGAAIIVLAIVGVMLVVWKNSQPVNYLAMTQMLTPNAIKDTKLIIPGQGSITLADRMQVSLAESGKISLRSIQGEVVSLENTAASGREMGMVVVPAGKRASILLSDGTKIEIHPGSQVVFPIKFREKKRELFILGEAFFEVSKNKHWPFVVKTDKINVEVLGTRFNVDAYPGHKEQSVVLVKGSVKVNTDGRNAIRIRPNQKYTFNEDHLIETVETVDAYPCTSWKEGYFLFNSEKLTVVLEKLSSYYGVSLHYQPVALDAIKLSGKLDLNNGLEEVLKVIATTTPIKYKTGKSHIEINVRN
jgi:ferric-dicitrate binding protein FerR (iron transport regulator)